MAQPTPVPFELDTLFKVARHRGLTQPAQRGYTFLVDGERQETTLTYGELDERARAIAARIQADCQPGEHVVLLYGPGLDYIAALFACQYAGVIPVPAYPPDPMRAARTLSRLRTIVSNCGAKLALTTEEHLGWLKGSLMGQLELRSAFSTEKWQEWVGLPWTAPQTHPDQVALLLYTSGSTALPRGVMATHRNLWTQFRTFQLFDRDDSAGVSWLPFYHDLGLIGGALTPIYFGRPVTLLSPLAFVQRPIRWLLAISRYRAPITGAPNFAFDLCVNRFDPTDAPDLDLSGLRIILTGAEPVRADTLDRFTATFGAYGLSPNVWRPGFGLAEATLGVTGVTCHSQLCRVDFSLRELERNQAVPVTTPDQKARRLVGCGAALEGAEVLTVDPQTKLALPECSVGEVWVRGPQVALGYWNRPEETETIFRARLADSGEGPFLRTGDLGFFHGGQLFLTGRLKEVMVFWGRNVYPQDVEMTTWSCHSALKQNNAAAFAIEKDGRERLVVVQEVLRPARLDLDAIAEAVRRAVQAEHQVPLDALVLIKPGTLPKTSSGKIQRNAVRDSYLAGELAVVRQWQFTLELGSTPPAEEARQVNRQEIHDWLTARIARHCGVSANAIDPLVPLKGYVLDSVSAVMIATELQEWLGRTISPTVLYDSPSLSVVADRLGDLCSSQMGDPQTSLATPPGRIEDLNPRELDEVAARLLDNIAAKFESDTQAPL